MFNVTINNMDHQHKIKAIKKWLGNGSINVFGLPYSGKDTIGMRLASELGAHFVSSGEILRNADEPEQRAGFLSPTERFYELVLPFFARPELRGAPLVLSEIGRWKGEEQRVIATADEAGHPIRAVLFINITEEEIYRRLDAARELGDRLGRQDDSRDLMKRRLSEFYGKVMPTIDTYRIRGELIEIDGMGSRDRIYDRVIDGLYDYSVRE
jgi:adenylate kinase